MRVTLGFVLKSDDGHYFSGFGHNGQIHVVKRQQHAVRWNMPRAPRDLAPLFDFRIVRLVERAPTALATEEQSK